MKNTLRVIAAVAAFAIATPAFAQGGGGGGGGMRMSPAERAARQKEQLFAGITLTADQSTKVDTIMAQAGRKQMEAMQAAGGDRAAMMETMQKMNAERNDALKAVLTDDQKKKFEENLAAMPRGRGGV